MCVGASRRPHHLSHVIHPPTTTRISHQTPTARLHTADNPPYHLRDEHILPSSTHFRPLRPRTTRAVPPHRLLAPSSSVPRAKEPHHLRLSGRTGQVVVRRARRPRQRLLPFHRSCTRRAVRVHSESPLYRLGRALGRGDRRSQRTIPPRTSRHSSLPFLSLASAVVAQSGRASDVLVCQPAPSTRGRLAGRSRQEDGSASSSHSDGEW